VVDADGRHARLALLVSLVLAWLNYALTARWAAVAGSIHGAKQPYYLAVLAALTFLAVTARGRLQTTAVRGSLLWPRVACAAAILFLTGAFFVWFPAGVWTQIPALDDWPPRYESTQQGLRLLWHGAFSGWRWDFLGGYPISTDVTQDLTIWAALPTLVFGPAVGFHVTHLLLFAAIPLLVWCDVRLGGDEQRDVALVAAGLAAVLSANYSYFLLRSGDTNSLTGAVGVLSTITAAHAARARPRAGWGAAFAVVAALTVTNFSHRGFFLYAILLLVIDAALARSRRALVVAGVASLGALIAGLPLTWELWRYPSYFIPNNVELHPAPFQLLAFARKVYYNTELLVRPGRWFNDFTGLANICIPLLALVAWRCRTRARFYAVTNLTVILLVRFSYESFGYVFLRPIILLPLLLAAPLSWFALRLAPSRAVAIGVLAFCALYIQIWWRPVPHVPAARDLQPELSDRIARAEGDLVLVENAFHRDVDTSPDTASVPTPFDAHFEALVPAATGRRLYAGMWDGWQWTPYRDQVFANGTFRGRRLADVDVAAFRQELARWGVRELFVWSAPARAFLDGSGVAASRESFGRWTRYVTTAAEASPGTAIVRRDPWGATVRIKGAQLDQVVRVRANYHPAWRARLEGRPLSLTAADGQLAFAAPRGGDYDVELEYPPRRWLLPVAAAAVLLAATAIARLRR
jgi:hypothetical protein